MSDGGPGDPRSKAFKTFASRTVVGGWSHTDVDDKVFVEGDLLLRTPVKLRESVDLIEGPIQAMQSSNIPDGQLE
jgi:hypothetical protein